MWHYTCTLIASRMTGRFLFVLSLLLGLLLSTLHSNAAPATESLSTSAAVALNANVGKDEPSVSADLVLTGEEVSLSGWFTIIWGDGEPGSQHAATLYMLIDDSGQATELLLGEKLAQSLGGILALNRQRVLVEGVWAHTLAQETERAVVHVQSLQPEVEIGATEVTRLTNAVDGPQPWVSILCKFSDIAVEPKPISYFQGMYGSTYPELDHYWREQSYDIVNVESSDAFGWYTLPQPRSYYVYGGEFDAERATEDCVAVANTDVYFPSYTGINMMFNADLGCCAWGGGWYMTLDGVSQHWSMTWEPPWGYQNMAIMGHEMGHGFGLPHSSGSYGYVYDNQWDVMSDAWTNCSLATDPVYGCLGQHTIAFHKDILGWIPDDQKYTATPGSSATITLERLALPQSNHYKMAQVPIDGGGNRFYTVEARQAVGYDVKLPGEGVIIHEVDTTRDEPAHVIDTDGNGDTGDEGAIWRVGETFTDPARGISISVDAATATGYSVTIDFFDSGPALSVPSGVPGYTGQPISVPVNFTSNGTNIASTTFSIDYDETCLAFDESDGDQDGIPDAVIFNAPAGFNVAVAFTESDSDGELDFLIADTSLPLSALIDDTLVTVTFTASCQPTAETSTEVSVAFSADPHASFGNTEGQSVPGAVSGGSVEILPSTTGDCNGDQTTDAGDISALVLEIFDGDGNDPADTPDGTFPGNPSCDANTDVTVDAGDISCLVLLIFNDPDACTDSSNSARTNGQPDLVESTTQNDGPELGIPSQVSASPGNSVTIPITFTANDSQISSLIFSIDYDQAWLSFDPADENSDGIPDAITFDLPAAFNASVNFENSDTKGELDFFIADLFPPLTTLPSGGIVYITLKAADSPDPVEALVQFSSEPPASFGNTSGQSVAGTTRHGSVLITSQDFKVYLPSVLSTP